MYASAFAVYESPTLTRLVAIPNLPPMNRAAIALTAASAVAITFAFLFRLGEVPVDAAYECLGCGADLYPEARLCRACGRGRH